jgi:hypothetical protein
MLWKLHFITNWVLNSIIEFDRKIENKNDLRKRRVDDLEWHLALEMPTSETAHARVRERTHLQNNIKVKPEQLKLSKTDPSTWP